MYPARADPPPPTVLFFHTQLRNRAKIVMESFVHLSYDSGVPGSKLFAVGDVHFRQTNALPVKGGYSTLSTDTDIFDAQTVSR